MSDPILSPHHMNIVRYGKGPPLHLLTSDYPPGAVSSVVVLLVQGAWLGASPMILGYAHHAQATSDWASGLLVLALGVVALASRRPVVSWLAGCVGLWVMFAPVFLRSPTLGAYLNDLVIGAGIVAVGLLEPMGRWLPGSEVPRGWSYNPSAWSQRAPVIVLSGLSATIAAYLAAYQLGLIREVWDPVFGDGTRRVLTSEVSRSLPISDAALGASTYLLDLLMTCAGDRHRWRTMPWIVLFFGFLIVPVGIVAAVLVLLQPIAVGAWCLWCLVTAAATLTMILLSKDEVAATLRMLRRVHRAGGSSWRVLWRGADDDAAPAPAPAQS